MGNCHPRKPMSTEAKPCQKYIELICNTSRRTVIIFSVSTWYSWCVMQPASPGILGICVRTSLCPYLYLCPVDQCDRKYGCRRNAPGRSLRKNIGNIFFEYYIFSHKVLFFLEFM